ncbi:MAG TPA: ABA4-like family protein [Pyrinomonadaceae bacterium]|nr:ABA4-like family protein [Pyrinomonadaceae bacterium]
MSPEKIFSICTTLVLPGWLLLIFLPRWRWTARIIAACVLPLALAVVYVIIVAVHFGHSEGGFGSLAEVGQLFRNPYSLLAGWIHYLAFDLFVGAWEVRDSRRVGIHHLLVVPCLALTFMFGPAGLLLYFLLRFTVARKFTVEESEHERA